MSTRQPKAKKTKKYCSAQEIILYFLILASTGYSQTNICKWPLQSEFLIDTNVVYVPVTAGSHDIVYNGLNYIAVWQGLWCNETCIFAARLQTDCITLDSAGILVVARYAYDPVIAFDGTNYLLVWEDYRNGTGYMSGCCDIYCARLSGDGTVIDPDGIPIATTINTRESDPAIAFDGTNYFVVWCRASGYPIPQPNDLYGARVSPEGVVLDPGGILISGAPAGQSSPSILFDGTNYFVVWMDSRGYPGDPMDIYGARIDPAGIVLDSNGIRITSAQFHQKNPKVAFDGANYFVVWEDARSGQIFEPDIYGARVSPEGLVLDPNGIPICTLEYEQSEPTIAFDGTNYLVAWSSRREDVYGARVSPDGIVLDPDGIPISTADFSQNSPAIAFDGTYYMVSWTDSRLLFSQPLYGTRVGTDGTVLDPDGLVISFAAYLQHHSSVAFDGTNYLAVWGDSRNGYSDLYGALISEDGAISEPGVIPISTADFSQDSPAIAFDGTNYFVVWTDRGAHHYVKGARVAVDGTVLDTNGLLISNEHGAYYPAVAFDGSNYLVVWQQFLNNSYDIHGARVGTDGTVLDTNGILISTAPSRQLSPAIAFDGTNYFVVWEDFRSLLNYDVYGARVSPDGIVLDPDGILISAAPAGQGSPSIAFDGTNYLIVWEDVRNGTHDIYGARVSPDGIVLDPDGILIAGGPAGQGSPSIAFDGTNYLIIWVDDSGLDIYGAQVDTSGAVIDIFPVASQYGCQCAPALVYGRDGKLLITYSGFIDTINGRPANTVRIWGKIYPFTAIHENAPCSAPFALSLEVYPNPFREKTRISYISGHNGKNVVLNIYDAAGRLVKQFTHLPIQPFNQILWDGIDNSGQRLPAGVYFVQFKSGDYNKTEKAILLR